MPRLPDIYPEEQENKRTGLRSSPEVLKNALPLLKALKQYLVDAAPGGALNPEVTPQGILDAAAISTIPVPGVGDIAGLAADLNRYRTDPESRTPGNFALTGIGLLPLVPAMSTKILGRDGETAAEAVKQVGAATSKVVPEISDKLRSEAARLEEKLFNLNDVDSGFYLARPGVKEEAINKARERYSKIREEVGLPPVVDWTVTPPNFVKNLVSGEELKQGRTVSKNRVTFIPSKYIKADAPLKLNNPVHLKNQPGLPDGIARVSGFTSPSRTNVVLYDKNGELYTMKVESIKPDDIDWSKDGNKTAEWLRKHLTSE